MVVESSNGSIGGLLSGEIKIDRNNIPVYCNYVDKYYDFAVSQES